MKHIPTPNALDLAGAWIGRSYALAPATFEAIEALHRICDIDGIDVHATANKADVMFWVFRRGDLADDTWMWSLELEERRGTLAVRTTTELSHGRAFLANLLCDAYTPVDADRLLQWWHAGSDGRRCTISITLPSSSADLYDMFTQLESATRDAAVADMAGRAAR